MHRGFNYYHSPIVCGDDTPSPPDEISDYVQTGRPGHRAPHAWLKDGRSTLDLFGRSFVLLCFARGTVGRSFADAARGRGFPMQIVDLSDETTIRALYGASYVLVRPDGHVAWRSDTQPEAVGRVIDTVRGFGASRHNVHGSEAAQSVADDHSMPAGSVH